MIYIYTEALYTGVVVIIPATNAFNPSRGGWGQLTQPTQLLIVSFKLANKWVPGETSLIFN